MITKNLKEYIKIDGGMGRCIAATGAIANCKRDISVVSSFPQLFDGVLDRVYPLDTHYLYNDHILLGDYKEPEPYNDYRFYREEKHLSQVYNYLLNGVDEYVRPIIHLSPTEKEFAKEFIDSVRVGRLDQNNGCNCGKCKDKPKKKPQKIKKKKKVLLFQPYARSGGTRMPDESYRSMSKDSIDKIVETFKKDYTILLVRAGNQATWSDTFPFTNNDIRRIISVIPLVDGIVCCDSFLHHAVAGLGNPVKTVVLWGGTSEKNFGHKGQTHLRVKDIEVEPNRVPHNHSYYVNKNKGCNDFTSLVDKVKEIIDGRPNRNVPKRKNTKNSRSGKKGKKKS